MKLKNLPNVELNDAVIDADTKIWLRDLDQGKQERHVAVLLAWYSDAYTKLLSAHDAQMAAAKCASKKYKQVEGLMSPGEAADSLVQYAKHIAHAIKRKDNAAFAPRVTSLNAILLLLNQYVAQDTPEYTSRSLSPLPVEHLHATERDGYEAGYAGKTDPNPYTVGTSSHALYRAGRERGDLERLANDTL